uniref:Family with sequence similarity 117 member Ab n=1 Tax=Cyclopterus lumpus TaxID=8103 RepID=A0A8C2ZDX9_CYCLU
MSGRNGVGQIRGATLGPQPLKATIPYQLTSMARPHRRDGKSGMSSTSGMRRTMSLDAIIGPYLQGHWPKEPEGQSRLSRKDKSTQVACNIVVVDDINTVLFPSYQLLEVPDGHRAPVPPQSCSSGSQSDMATTPFSSSSSFSSSSYSSSSNVSLPLLMSSSPGPNKSCCFQREPPEGCEKIRVWEETRYPALLSSCPDPNKVNFTPHGGSAFCPVSLLKPLHPSMDLLFRSLAVSPAGSCVWVK